MSFVANWVFKLRHDLSFWALSLFDFLSCWVLSQPYFFKVLSQFWFSHNLSFWVENFQFLRFVRIWVFDMSKLEPFSFVTIWVFELLKIDFLSSKWWEKIHEFFFFNEKRYRWKNTTKYVLKILNDCKTLLRVHLIGVKIFLTKKSVWFCWLHLPIQKK